MIGASESFVEGILVMRLPSTAGPSAFAIRMLVKNHGIGTIKLLGSLAKVGRVEGTALIPGRLIDKGKCLARVRAGIDHLYALNIVHNDINTGNVMMGAA